jgi:tetratricopeptide (TPR) repeat protein
MAVAASCGACGRVLSAADRFCAGCGAAVQASSPAPSVPRPSARRRIAPFVLVLGVGLLAVLGFFGVQELTLRQELDQRYADAVGAADRQDWGRAVDEFGMVVSKRPWHRDAAARLDVARTELRRTQLYAAAMERYRASDWTAAVGQLESLLKDGPYKDAEARLADARREVRLAQTYESASERLRAGAWADAVKGFDTLLAETKQFPDAESKLGQAKKQLGFQQEHEAARVRLAAKDFAVGLPVLVRLGASDYADAARVRAELAQAQKDYAADLLQRGVAAERAKNWSEAERLARLTIAQDGQSGKAHALLGNALDQQKRYPEARAALAMATRLDPTNAGAFNLLGWAHLNGSGGDAATAERALQEAVRLNPKLANALSGLGHVQLQQKRNDAARRFFETWIPRLQRESVRRRGEPLPSSHQDRRAASDLPHQPGVRVVGGGEPQRREGGVRAREGTGPARCGGRRGTGKVLPRGRQLLGRPGRLRRRHQGEPRRRRLPRRARPDAHPPGAVRRGSRLGRPCGDARRGSRRAPD